jgi:type II secretory pathway pseudopilin PulG
MVVVIMMGLLAGAAALTLSKPMREARAFDAFTTVRSFDETARTVARRSGRPTTLRFDFSANLLQRFEDNRLTQQVQLPFGFRVTQIRTAARRASEGDAEILCSPMGITRTYAVRIQGSGEFKTWLLVSGFSGEVTAVTDESKLDAIFSATATRSEAANATGDDAD